MQMVKWVAEGGGFRAEGPGGLRVRFLPGGEEPPDALRVKQVHSARVVSADRAGEEADGLLVTERGTRAAVATADCFPVVLAAPEGFVLLHAGWRGTAGGIAEEGLRALLEACATPTDVTALFGPGICGGCYRVGPYVASQLKPAVEKRDGGLYASLVAYNANILRQRGVQTIVEPPACTVESEELYSYRRDGTKERHCTVVWRD